MALRTLARAEVALVNVMPKRMQTLWHHPAGLKTIHFWAPAFKWGLVIAGFADSITRPGDKLSLFQCSSLAATGLIWSRYSVVIVPKNYLLLSVNMCVALTSFVQLGKIWAYRRSLQEATEKS